MPINVDSDCFHCPVCTHYHKLALSDILPGLKRRCNREGAVIVELWIVIAPSSSAHIVLPKTVSSFTLKVSLYAYVVGGKGHDVDKPKILLEYE